MTELSLFVDSVDLIMVGGGCLREKAVKYWLVVGGRGWWG